MTKKYLIIAFLPFFCLAQQDSIIHNNFSNTNVNISDLAKKYILFQAGFQFSASNSKTLQSRIKQPFEENYLKKRKISTSYRNMIYSDGKIIKVVLYDLNDTVLGYDSLYYNDDTLKKIVNFIPPNTQRTWNFQYSTTSILPISYNRTDINYLHYLFFNSNQQLIQDNYAQNPIISYSIKKFYYDGNGNLTSIIDSNADYDNITNFHSFDTSQGMYSSSLYLKLWSYVRGFSEIVFSVNNPITYTQTLPNVQITGNFQYIYHANGFPKYVNETTSAGLNRIEEFEFY